MERSLNMYIALSNSGRVLAAEVAKATKIKNYGHIKKQLKAVLTAYLAANQNIVDKYKDDLELKQADQLEKEDN